MTDTTTAAGQAAPAGEPGPLDEMILASLAGPHARFAERHGRAIRFHTDVAPFAAMAGGPGRWPWDDLATLVGPGGGVALFHVTEDPPPGWQVELRAGLVQMIATGRFVSAPEPEARRLTRADVPAMLDLVERTQPGPFRPRTIELGAYLGIFDGPRLVAMAGERMRAGGYTEISAVCTDPAYR
ncbi:MAG: GNAT family N-acetyltransferase, partial [Frankia sp.]|nr:GNAT family N-acetyltransferase [Frankia sp.]